MPYATKHLFLVHFCASAFACACATSPLHVESVPSADSLFHLRGDGVGVVSATIPDPSKNGDMSRKVLCAMPPAQAALDVKVSTTGKGAVKAKEVEVSGEVSRAIEQAAAKLFEQNEQTLFVQHTLYRLCEANANGMLEGVSARDILIGEHAVAAEQLAGIDARLAIATRAKVDAAGALIASQRALQSLDDELKGLRARLKGASAAIQAETKAAIDTLEERRKAALQELDSRRAVDADAQKIQDEMTVTQRQWAGRVTALSDAIKRLPLGATGKGSAYGALFNRVFTTAARLSEIDVERQRALADRAKAEAEKAKAEVEKAKAEAEKAKAEKVKVEEKLEALQKALIDASVTRATCTGDCKDGEEKQGEEKKDAEKKTAK